MTTPPTPAGWYPDPDGSGGQRYWDGSTWTEHRSPAAPEPTPTAEPAAHTEPAGSEQPTTVVPLQPAGGHGGAHRAPDSEAETGPEAGADAGSGAWPQPPQEPEPGPTAVFDLPSTPPSEQKTSVIHTPIQTPPAATFMGEPPAAEAAGDPGAHDRRRKDLVLFGVTSGVLMAVLIAVVVYAIFFHKDNTISAASGPKTSATSSTSGAPTTTSANGWNGGTQSTTESPGPASGSGPKAVDGGITFAVTGTETAASVKSQQAPVEQTAQGQYVIVHMTLSDTGDQPGSFVGSFQKLKAGGTTYSIDDVATAYLNGTVAQLNPGDNVDVSLAFDVPAGTTPDALEVHADPSTAGAEIPLS